MAQKHEFYVYLIQSYLIYFYLFKKIKFVSTVVYKHFVIIWLCNIKVTKHKGDWGVSCPIRDTDNFVASWKKIIYFCFLSLNLIFDSNIM